MYIYIMACCSLYPQGPGVARQISAHEKTHLEILRECVDSSLAARMNFRELVDHLSREFQLSPDLSFAHRRDKLIDELTGPKN